MKQLSCVDVFLRKQLCRKKLTCVPAALRKHKVQKDTLDKSVAAQSISVPMDTANRQVMKERTQGGQQERNWKGIRYISKRETGEKENRGGRTGTSRKNERRE